jgi:hypothetical protein
MQQTRWRRKTNAATSGNRGTAATAPPIFGHESAWINAEGAAMKAAC